MTRPVPRKILPIAMVLMVGLLSLMVNSGTVATRISSSFSNHQMTSYSTSNPIADVQPNPNFLTICNLNTSIDSSASCQAAALLAIDNARAQEGVGPMVLPANYGSLTLPEQLLVVVNLERQDRGLPDFIGLTTDLNASAALGAAANTDPTLNSNIPYAANWAGGLPSVLTADYEWMYDDGFGSANIDCTSPTSSGCWGHRDNILANFSTSGVPAGNGVGLYMGAAANSGAYQGELSLATIEAEYSPSTTPVFDWSSVATPPSAALQIGYFGSTSNTALNKPIVGMASTPDGKGYWLVASDGGIFTFGDAGYYGSTGAMVLNKPIVGMASTPDGKGYWLVASDGGIFTFGDAGYYGSEGAAPLNSPVTGIITPPTGNGYWEFSTQGDVFPL